MSKIIKRYVVLDKLCGSRVVSGPYLSLEDENAVDDSICDISFRSVMKECFPSPAMTYLDFVKANVAAQAHFKRAYTPSGGHSMFIPKVAVTYPRTALLPPAEEYLFIQEEKAPSETRLRRDMQKLVELSMMWRALAERIQNAFADEDMMFMVNVDMMSMTYLTDCIIQEDVLLDRDGILLASEKLTPKLEGCDDTLVAFRNQEEGEYGTLYIIIDPIEGTVLSVPYI